ncbi:MAG: ATP synthase F1 subunit epsilon [Candidatus Omnitrophica bacterium]|nr:ATP synthase F1 subunit epsilon [Candidatus Omnitrophota bacterium]
MSDKPFQLEILTPLKKAFSGSVTSLIVPAARGYLGVWANHAPMVDALRPGRIILRETGGSERTIQLLSSGVLEVRDNKATLLADKIS